MPSPGQQAAAFADLLAQRIEVFTGRRPEPDPTPGGPLRMLDAALGRSVVDEALASAMYGSTADQLHREVKDKADAFASRTAARTTAWMELRRPLLTAWRPIEHWDAAEAVRSVLSTSRQLPGPFAAAADALLLPEPSDLEAAPVRVEKQDLLLVRGPLERLASGHLHMMFDTIWETLKDQAVGGRSARLAKGVMTDLAEEISPSLMDAKHAAERDGDHSEAARYTAPIEALASPARPPSPTNPAIWYSTSLSGRLGNWAALGCIAAEMEPQWAGWVTDLVPLPPMLLPPEHALESTVRSDLSPMADWWRARREATRTPHLFLDDDEFAQDPHEARTVTLTRYRARASNEGPQRPSAEESHHQVALAAFLADPDHRTLLIGPPGSGKSDSIRVAAHAAADLRLRARTADPGRTVVAAEATAVTTAPGTTLLTAAIAAADPEATPEMVEQLARAATADPQPIVMIDGYDEIADPAGRARLLDLVHSASHPVVITTRPEHRSALLERLLPSTVHTFDLLGTDATRRVVMGWLAHIPEAASTAVRLLESRPRIAALCTTPLYARLLAMALAGRADPNRLATGSDLLHTVLAVRVTDPARSRRPLPLTAEEIEDRIDAAAGIGLAHLEARSVSVGSISPPRERVRRRDLRPLLSGAPVPAGVLEDVLSGLGIVDLGDDRTVSWPHQLLGEYLAGRALADLACSPDPDAQHRYTATVLKRRAFQSGWVTPLALCTGELDRRARMGDPRAVAAIARHRTLLTDPVFNAHSTPAEIRTAAATTSRAMRTMSWEEFTSSKGLVDSIDTRTHARGELLRLAAVSALELADASAADQVLIEVGRPDEPSPEADSVMDPVDLIRTTSAIDAIAEWLRARIATAEVEDAFSGWTITPVDGATYQDVWEEVVRVSEGDPHANLADAFANRVPAAMALHQQLEIQACIDASSADCSCWPLEKRLLNPTIPPSPSPVLDPSAHDAFAKVLLDELVSGSRRPRQRSLHGLLSLMARGSLAAASGLLRSTRAAAIEMALGLLDAVPAGLHVDPASGPHPRTLHDVLPWEPPTDLDDLGVPLPPATESTQFRAATLLLSGRAPDALDPRSTGDLFRMGLTSRATGLPPSHFDHWVALILSRPVILGADGAPDWKADRDQHSELLQVVYPIVGDRLAHDVDDEMVRHRIMCPAAWHRRWANTSHLALDQAAVCDAVGHHTDDRWLGRHDNPTPETVLRGLEAAERAAKHSGGDWYAYAHDLGAVLVQAGTDLSQILSASADPALTKALAKVLHAAGLEVPPVSDPAAVWHTALQQTRNTGNMDLMSEHDVLAGLLLRSARWPEALHLDVEQVAQIADSPSR